VPASYEVGAAGSHESSPCEDCGGFQRTVWGAVKKDGAERAVYYARWHIGHRERGLRALVSLGGWGKDEDEEERRAFAFDCPAPEPKKAPALEAIDASSVAWSEKAPIGQPLSKDEALALPELLDEARAIAAVVLQQDERVRAFVARGGRDTRRATALVEQAYAKLNASDDVGAEVDATNALGHDPELWEAYFMRGWARARAEQHDDAIADLEKYLSKAPKGKHAARATKILAMAKKKGPAG
jgi:hypothetical protein